jgi:iron complex transport system ATP-binding protein
MSDSAFAVEGVAYRVDSSVLLNDVNLVGLGGELIALCGPNGAGKTTLIRLLAGDLEPTEGRIRIGEYDATGTSAHELARARSVMRQGGRSDIPFTSLAVVEMGRYPHRSDPDASRARDVDAITSAMERTDTMHLAQRVFGTLSGGEQTRVVMARILAQQSPVVLLDEPTTALDVAHQERILTEIRRIADQGDCVVGVFHDLNSAAHYADRLVLLDQGEVVAMGTADEVLRGELLSQVYGQKMLVTRHPTRDCPLVLVG